jgi:uncharacterized protein YbjQ (UPF0145 family)
MSDNSSGGADYEWLILPAIYLLPILATIVFGFIGSYVERKHYAAIRSREAATAGLPIIVSKTLEAGRVVRDAHLVFTAVVISHDHFKRFLANLRSIFGGRIRSYDTLMDRARREALLRLKEQCPDASLIANLRLETSTLSKNRGNRGVVAVEVIAYGTAIRYGDSSIAT